MQNETFLNTAEAAELLKVSRITLWRWRMRAKNPLPSFRAANKKVLYDRQEIENWIQSQQPERATP